MQPQPHTHRPASRGRGVGVLVLLGLLGVCGALRLGLICTSDLIARDGTIYIRMARQWSESPAAVIRDYDYHVGYPAVVSAVARLMIAAGGADDIATWDLAGQLVSLAASLAAMAAVWVFARKCFNDRVAWITVLIFGAGRKWAALGADALSDSLAVCLQMWAVALAMVTLERLARASKWSVALAGGVGLAAGLGYLVRPEGLLAGGLAGMLWLAYQFRRRKSWAITLAALAVNAAAALACVLPYALAIGGLTKKKSLSEFVHRQAAEAQGCLQAAVAPAGLLRAVGRLGGEMAEALHPIVAVLACIWVGALIARRVLPIRYLAELSPRLRLAGGFVMAAALAVMGPLLLGLYTNVQYLSHRHVMFLAALVSPLAGAGLLIAAKLSRSLADCITRRIPAVEAPLWVGGVLVGLSLHAYRPLHADKGYFRQAGEYLSANAGADAVVLTDNSWVLHYSQLPGRAMSMDAVSRKHFFSMLRWSQATHLAVSDRQLSKAEADLTVALAGRRFVHVKDFPQQGARKPDIVRVYEVHLPPDPKPTTKPVATGP